MTYFDIKSEILDNVTANEDGFTSKEIILDDINLIAEDTADQVMADLVDYNYEPFYGIEDYGSENFINETKEDYIKEIKDIIQNNIDQIVTDYNNMAQRFIDVLKN